jgi:Zn-dependent protease
MTLLQLLFSEPWQFLATILAFLLTLGIHESAHAWTAFALGDNTAQREGRLTLNPLAHIDFLGFMTLVTVGFGWGKPVPFNPYNLRWQRVGPVLVAAAGPVSNFLITLVSTLLLRVLLPILPETNLLILFLFTLAGLSCLLGLFNLIPLPRFSRTIAMHIFAIFSRHVDR